MAVEDGQWIMRGVEWDDPHRIKSWQELLNWIDEVGFLPLFANEVKGFSVEEHVSPDFWWTGNQEQDPWEWREVMAKSRKVAYGKFFAQKAGFISLKWFPHFVNYRRNGYDFDARWEDGLASRREKRIMDLLLGRDADGDAMFPDTQILSSDLKKQAGFGKDGEKNFPGTIAGLQMQTYLVTTDFRKRRNKKSEEYGMPVSVLQPPEAVWSYETVTSAYGEEPLESWQSLIWQVKKAFPEAERKDIISLIGKQPCD